MYYDKYKCNFYDEGAIHLALSEYSYLLKRFELKKRKDMMPRG